MAGIDFHDWFELVATISKGDPRRVARFVFDAFDLNDDGVVDSHDVFTCLQLGYHRVLGNDMFTLAKAGRRTWLPAVCLIVG